MLNSLYSRPCPASLCEHCEEKSLIAEYENSAKHWSYLNDGCLVITGQLFQFGDPNFFSTIEADEW